MPPAQRVDRADCMKELVRTDDDCFYTLLNGTLEGRVGLAFAAGLQDARAGRPMRAPQLAHLGFGVRKWEFPGLTSKPKIVALGTSSRNRSNRFAPSVFETKVTPVMLPPGRLKLETRPTPPDRRPSQRRSVSLLSRLWQPLQLLARAQ